MAKKTLGVDIYLRRMFKVIMLFIPFLALFAGICFTVLKLGFNGKFYKDVNLTALIIFDCTTLIYCALGLFFGLNCEDANKNLKPKYVFVGKIIISCVVAIQWNFISYMIPSRDFWGFFVLFIMVSVFFLDRKYVLLNIGIVVISMFISWAIKPNELLPVRDEYFVPDLSLRCILIVLMSVLIYCLTLIVEKLLVKELENIAEYDSLTLLRNRRSLSIKMDEAIEEYNKSGKEFCFLMSDIDDFKVVNDTYGHPFGDIVLKNISKIFLVTVGDKGDVFRYGGEEICSLIYCDLEESIAIAEQIRKAIEKETHVSEKIKVKVTMSFGITEYKPKLKKEDILKISDSNLYYAKSHGKNKVIN